MTSKPNDFKEYIATYPKEVQQMMKQLRATILKAAPGAEEVISYAMPAFKLNGLLVWIAAYKNHIGLYPKPSAIKAFSKELATYKTSKGAIQLPLDKPLPLPLITRIVKYRVNENKEKEEVKGKK